MQGSELFLRFVLHLRNYADAAVLWVALKERADIKEFRTTSMLMSHIDLCDTIDRSAAKRSFKRLAELGLIDLQIHPKTATKVIVNREAVLELLRGELDERLPGLDASVDFPFLQAWAEDRAQRAAAP